MRGKKTDTVARYRVTKNIPIPPLHDPDRYPLKRLKVGYSFGFPEEETQRVRSAITRYREAGAKSVRFTIRKDSPKRCRCWRIA